MEQATSSDSRACAAMSALKKIILSHTSLMARVPAGRSFIDAARDGALRAGFAVSDMQFSPADDPACRRRL
jgi:hypothetical protein